jgi:hypothetical protein
MQVHLGAAAAAVRITHMLIALVTGFSAGSSSASENAEAKRLRSAVEECRTAASPMHGRTVQLFETTNAVCFIGRFDRFISESILPKLSDNRKVFVAKSPGGYVIDAARVGIHVFEKRIDVAVFDFCFSACANYVFLAGRRKYVAEGTLLAWHGAPRTEKLTAGEKVLDGDGRLDLTRQLSDCFFRKAGISRVLATDPNTANPDYPAWQARMNSNRRN